MSAAAARQALHRAGMTRENSSFRLRVKYSARKGRTAPAALPRSKEGVTARATVDGFCPEALIHGRLESRSNLEQGLAPIE